VITATVELLSVAHLYILQAQVLTDIFVLIFSLQTDEIKNRTCHQISSAARFSKITENKRLLPRTGNC